MAMYFKGYGKGVNFKGYAGGGKGGAGKSWPAPREDGSGVRQFAPGFTPRKMCIHFPQGKCSRGAGCTFAHSLDELSPDSPELAGRTDSQDAEAGVEESMMAEQTAAAEAEAAAEAAAEADAEAAAQAAEEELLAAEQTEAELAADDADAAMDEGSGAGLLEGPREFVEAPQSLCASWLQHPSLCAQGDQCTLAHGLAELGSISESALFMKFDGPDSIACEVRPADVARRVHTAQQGMARAAPTATMRATPSYGPLQGRKGAPSSYAPGGKSGPYSAVGKDGKGKGKGGGAPAAAALALGDQGRSRHVGGIQMPEPRHLPEGGFKPRKICSFWRKDPHSCRSGDACNFAHGILELHPDAVADCEVGRFLHTGVSPTKLCTYWQSGNCQRGLACTFAHGEQELQGLQDSLWS